MNWSRMVAASALAALLAGPALAQQAALVMPDGYKDVQLHALQLQRRTLLAMVDSMPERLYRDKVTPVQRDFAQQIEHAAGSLVFVASRFLNVPAPAAGDTAQYLNSRAGLRGFVNGCYDWAEGVLRNQTAADRGQMVNMFGNRMPAWQVWDELHQHTFWTAGQVVANFRKHGMAPPGFGFF